MTNIQAVSKERQIFFDKLIENEEQFFIKLSESLDGSYSSKQTRKIYTIATQLFHRLWWNDSRNRDKRYKNSLAGKSYKDLLVCYEFLNNFPKCLIGTKELLENKIKLLIHEICQRSEINEDKELKDFKEEITECLEKEYPTIDSLIVKIEKIKHCSNSSSDKRLDKKLLKQQSIQLIIFPIIWSNLIREFLNNPFSFIKF